MPKIKPRNNISLDTIRNRITITQQDISEAKLWLDAILERTKLQNGVVAEVVNLTPARAKEMQSRNMNNRVLRGPKIAEYVSDITAGRWSLNGEAIIVDRNGIMVNGQHRCEAVIQANISIQTMMVFGVEEDAKYTMDTGVARSVGDHLQIAGHDYGNNIASLVRMIIAYERSEGENFSEQNFISKAEVFERSISDESFRVAVTAVSPYIKSAKGIVSPSILAFVFWITNRIDPNDALTFIEQVGKGENLTEIDAAYHARMRLTQLKSTSRAPRIEILLRCWNAFRRKRIVKTYVKVTGTFPKLV